MTIKRLCFIASTVMTFLGLIFWGLLPAVQTDLSLNVFYSFMDLTFGETFLSQTLYLDVFKFSTMNFIGLILLMSAYVYHLLLALNIKVLPKFDAYIGALLSLIAGIFALLVIDFSSVETYISKANYLISFGPYFIFGVCLIGALISLLSNFIFKDKKLVMVNIK